MSDPRRGGSNPAFGTSRDIAGIIVWSIGLFIESIADIQKVTDKVSNFPLRLIGNTVSIQNGQIYSERSAYERKKISRH